QERERSDRAPDQPRLQCKPVGAHHRDRPDRRRQTTPPTSTTAIPTTANPAEGQLPSPSDSAPVSTVPSAWYRVSPTPLWSTGPDLAATSSIDGAGNCGVPALQIKARTPPSGTESPLMPSAATCHDPEPLSMKYCQ